MTQKSSSTHLDWQERAPGVLVAVAEPDAVNLVIVRPGPDSGGGTPGALLVDTGSTPHQGRQVRQDVVALTGADPAHVVITHGHRDHWFGLAAFDGIPSHGHASLRDRLHGDELTADRQTLGVGSDDVVLPNRPMYLARGLDLGGRRVEIVHLGPGHTDGDLVVVVPDAGVLIAGDLLESADVPQLGPDSDLGQWPTTLDGVIGVLDADSVVIPGHGAPMTRDDAVRQRSELAAVSGEARALIERGVGRADALTEGNWPWPLELMEAPISHAYTELEARGLVPRPQLPIVIERRQD